MLKELINKFYLDRQRDREQHHFYISDAGKCSRAIFFKFKKVPREEIEARVLRLFDHGDSIHRLIMKPLLSTKEAHVVASEVDIPPRELIRGRADAVISDGKDLYILDIKSMNSMVFKNLNQPKKEHIDQIQLYLHYLDPKKGILLYVNKDTQELKEFLINYDSNRAQSLLKVLSDLKTKIDSNIIPPRIPEWPENWQCQYCQFKEICLMTGEGDVSWENFKKIIETQGETGEGK
ncbi:PD-(D/E)XK nuclease family protein [Patescibacteria group bacterium]|nr:PD-(D/E)XK nuclease family protein [Patescibacteria group bacterium]